MILRRTPTRYLPPIPFSNFFSHPFSSANGNDPQSLDHNVDIVFRIISSSQTQKDMINSLKSSKVFLSNELIDSVLKRVRFSHGNPLQALDFFNYAGNRKGFYHTAYSVDTMLYILGRGRKFQKIWDVLLDVKLKDQSVITPRTVMVVLGRIAKVCSVMMTVESFRKFKKLVPEFDVACYNALLRTLCQEKSMRDAREVYHAMKNKFRPNLQTFNILLSGWKSSAVAEGFFNEMRELGVKPDVVSYNCLVDVYCKNREVDKACKVVERMREEDIPADVITYTSIIGGLGLVGRLNESRDMLKEMKELGCYPDVAAYNAVIRNFCVAKRFRVAFDLMDEMVNEGLSPNATTYNLFFRIFFWSNDWKSAWNMYRRMMDMGCLPNTQSCLFLIKLFKKYEQVDMALELWNDMIERGFGSYLLVSEELIDLLCDLGKLAEAERSFLQMIDKGHKPRGVSFKRIKVLMELANKPEAIQNLINIMEEFFGPSKCLPETTSSTTDHSFTC